MISYCCYSRVDGHDEQQEGEQRDARDACQQGERPLSLGSLSDSRVCRRDTGIANILTCILLFLTARDLHFSGVTLSRLVALPLSLSRLLLPSLSSRALHLIMDPKIIGAAVGLIILVVAYVLFKPSKYLTAARVATPQPFFAPNSPPRALPTRSG